MPEDNSIAAGGSPACDPPTPVPADEAPREGTVRVAFIPYSEAAVPLDLLDIVDRLNEANDFFQAARMATERVIDAKQRNALARVLGAGLDVLRDATDTLAARQQQEGGAA